MVNKPTNSAAPHEISFFRVSSVPVCVRNLRNLVPAAKAVDLQVGQSQATCLQSIVCQWKS
jgi:hypothetical protein